jgi:23S rRNA (cytosine1962-C5)-methyltransferase
MRYQQLLAKGRRGEGSARLPLRGYLLSDSLGRQPGQVAPAVAVFGREGKRHKRRTAFRHSHTELTGDLVTQPGGTDLRDGQAARRHHHRFAGYGALCRGHAKSAFACGCSVHPVNPRLEQCANAGVGAVAFERRYQITRAAVAEELAQRLLVVRDAMPFHQCNHVRGRKADERGAGEVRVFREKVGPCTAQVGKVGAAAAGDEDLLPDAVGVVQKKHAASATACLRRAQQARRASAQNRYIALLHARLRPCNHHSKGFGLPEHSARYATIEGMSKPVEASPLRVGAVHPQGPLAQVTRRAADRLRAGSVWVYRSEVEQVRPGPDAPLAPGSLINVVDSRGLALGSALFSSASQIPLRLVSDTSALTRAQYLADVESRVETALDLRERLAPVTAESNACRLIFSEADRLPGLVADCYNDLILLQTLTQGTAQDDVRGVVTRVLRERCAPATIVERADARIRIAEELGPAPHAPLYAANAAEPKLQTTFRLNGLEFAYDAESGQKTGAFLDQRLNYAAAEDYAHGRALDVCTYQGGFALHLARRCEKVTGVDTSRAALKVADANFERNADKLQARVDWVEADAFDLVREWEATGQRFDTIVLDPPAFAKSKRALEGALRGYKELNLRALKMLNAGGILVTCSCSHHVALPEFTEMLQAASVDAGRRVQVLETRGAAPDHPAILTLPETNYLKCLICRMA